MKLLRLFVLLLVFVAPAFAQSHSAALSWTLSTDDVAAICTTVGTTCSQAVYRAPGACSTSSVFVLISSPSATATTFTDTTITPGTYCYAVTFVENSLESTKDTITVILPPSSPSGLAVVAK